MSYFQSIPVCMFHHVNENSGDFITVTVGRFREMMSMLVERGYTTLSSLELRDALQGRSAPPQRPVALTFDDAWLDIRRYAYPILEEFRLKFIVFVISRRTERASLHAPARMPEAFPLHREAVEWSRSERAGEVVCTWKDLREMLSSGLCSVENHTSCHGETGDIGAEIAEGRALIRARLGVPADQLCWPKGRHDAAMLAAARSHGIDTTYLTRRGVNIPGCGSFKVKRFTVEDRDAMWLARQLAIYSRPVTGWLYGRIKPDRLRARWKRWRKELGSGPVS